MILSAAERLKFRLLAEGMAISVSAAEQLDRLRGERKLTPADYSSTTGLILRLEGNVWVNAPTAAGDGHFVADPTSVLDVEQDGFVIRCDKHELSASVWLPPQYHDQLLSTGRPANHFAFTHGDRVRLSPLRGCVMRCRFCCIPYQDSYGLKPVDLMLEALRRAFEDPLQPARHVLISGGTPAPRDAPFLKDVYEQVLRAFPERDVDIMMVPVEGLFDLKLLCDLGLNELSINIELVSEDVARVLMPQKHWQGIATYLEFISRAADVLGQGRVRSMLMVGLEPVESTLRGVRAVLDAGGVPVLSPFRPDPSTPLRDHRPLSAEEYEEVFVVATGWAEAAGLRLGPSCPPCTHNTLTLVPRDSCIDPSVSPNLV